MTRERKKPESSDIKSEDAVLYKVRVSRRFLLLSFIATSLLAFAVGSAARIILLKGPSGALMSPHDSSSMRIRPDHHVDSEGMPQPILMEGKKLPKTVYSAKLLDTAASVTSSSLLVPETKGQQNSADDSIQSGSEKDGSCPVDENGNKQCTRGHETVAEEEPVEEEHLPTGQHLLVDIKDVDGNFLNSVQRLARAMVELITESELTLLSYHCHTLLPTGVSCVGVLLESHVSFHTWPDEGVITLDLFTCGSKPLIPTMPDIERLFGVPRVPSYPGELVETPSMIWAHKLRGFRPLNVVNPLAGDLTRFIYGIMDMDMKKELVSVQTPFQRIDIYEVINPRFNDMAAYRRSLSNDGSYESLHPEFFQPDRLVFLDGVEQSTLWGDAPYHEALVHPAMFSHNNPERVAIIGGGEGATLREVLKHNTVKQAIMVEIDDMMVNIAHEHLPSWSDCSNLVGSAEWCIEDPRANVYYEDALTWFIDRFNPLSEESKITDQAEQLDVIIMDALDPEDDIAFADTLYNNDVFLSALFNALSNDGIIVMQLGESADQADPPEIDCKENHKRAVFVDRISKAGFQSMHIYEEGHSGFDGNWLYLVAFKNYETRYNWYLNAAQIDLAIHKRVVPTKSGGSPLKYFDGSTMKLYQNPPKVVEAQYCLQTPTPSSCTELRSFDPDLVNADMSVFELSSSGIGEQAGRGIFTKSDIPENAYLGLEEAVHGILFKPPELALMTKLPDVIEAAVDSLVLSYYSSGYGFESKFYGLPENAVDSSLLTFVNHGCKDSHNIGFPGVDSITEQAADPNEFPEEYEYGYSWSEGSGIHDPVVARNLRHLIFTKGLCARRDISAGEEMFSNYVEFIANPNHWEHDIKSLRAMCDGTDVGVVSEYESARAKSEPIPDL